KHLYSMITILLGTLVMSVVLVTITLRVINGATPLSVFVFIWSSTQSLHATLGGTLRSIAQQNEFALYAADMYAVRDATPEAVRRNDSIVCADRIPEIVFEHVAFQYPFDKKGREILQDISFKIRPGERLALVGCNAAGKTTIVRLICGIYEPTKGRILVDGVDLKEIDINSWRKQLSVLFQNYAQYNIIVREVIALGDTKCEPTDEHIAEAANQSGVDKFVADLPDGYKTQIGKDFKDGIEPSGGQNQRIALARVAYRQGKVVILDEPTASLDAFAEAEIFEELEHHSGRSTLILITHRFSTIKIADHIVVLDHGKIIEEGSHTSLMRNNGLYADMYLKQARGYMDQPIDIDKEEG
ncbi:MAG: ABC transporter ATP-binding protein, partial [Candidatus Taylorbacteria bacterium]|nr:ABC transporter ATP-binding protein [Candidatus Taylorbacteria bacterium]